MAPDDWRRYRLTRGTYGQRQDGVQMLRVKAPQGIVSSGADARVRHGGVEATRAASAT